MALMFLWQAKPSYKYYLPLCIAFQLYWIYFCSLLLSSDSNNKKLSYLFPFFCHSLYCFVSYSLFLQVMVLWVQMCVLPAYPKITMQ